MDRRMDMHLDVYLDHSELHVNGRTTLFCEGRQSPAAQRRYEIITQTLDRGYLKERYDESLEYDFDLLSAGEKRLLNNLVNGITSEVGRALVGLAFLQLTIKSICPEQSVRLHKGSKRSGSFSWVEGISMRTIDSHYITPFLREYDLLSINRDGIMMTRSLAENYPYTRVYKAEMRGPFNDWISVVESLEDNTLQPKAALEYLLSLLINKSNRFQRLVQEANGCLQNLPCVSLNEVQDLLVRFFTRTRYSARAFEVVIHAFMQAYVECRFTEYTLVPLSQMRSANKKHGNVGDIELMEGHRIIEAWDAKYGKTYLYEELGELEEKLEAHPGVCEAGFVVNRGLELKPEIEERSEAVSAATDTEIKLFDFDDWISYKTQDLNDEEKRTLARRWLTAVMKTFSRERMGIAPIDEPCDGWLADLVQLTSALR